MIIHQLNLSLKDDFPLLQHQVEKEEEFGLHFKLFEDLIPDFKKCVKFALIEILELDRTISAAKTWGYSDLSEEKFAELVADYFAVINAVYSEPGFSVSSCDDFYYGDCIYFSRITNPAAPSVNVTSHWHKLQMSDLDRSYHEDNNAPPAKVKMLYQDYASAMGLSILKRYPVSYILCVPVALNGKNHQRKVGAAFIHIGLNEQFDSDVEKLFAKEVFRMVNLYWHYRLTAESLHRQVEFANTASVAALSAEAAAKKADDLLQELMKEQLRYADDVLPLVRGLEMQVNVIKEQIAPQPHIRVQRAFLSLKDVCYSCFSETGPLHDPCGHTDLNALTLANQNQRIHKLVKSITENLLKIDPFKEDQTTVDLFLNPLINLPENQVNDPLAPHPALCLAKHISSKKIPFPWIPVALGFKDIEDAHWRHFLHLRGTQDEQSFSALDVFCTLKTLAKKLGLKEPTMQLKDCCTVTMTFQPTWEEDVATRSLNRICEQMRSSDRGGTRTALMQLLNIGFKVQILDQVFWLEQYWQDSEPNEICVNDNCVKFTLFTHHEKKP